MSFATPTAPGPQPGPWQAPGTPTLQRSAGSLLALAVLVLLLHAWLLQRLGDGRTAPQETPPRPSLQARRIALAPPPSPAAPTPATPSAPAPSPAPRVAPKALNPSPTPPVSTPEPKPQPPAPEPWRSEAGSARADAQTLDGDTPAGGAALAQAAAAAAAATAAQASQASQASASSVPSAAAASAPAAAQASVEPPVYATRPPASARLQYDVQVGRFSVSGELQWRNQSGAYELSLRASALGITAMEQSSRGSFDSAGLAPHRFEDSRRGRAARAVNFQREAGKILYSASSAESPLPRGAQDRLSVLVQLTAIAAANPQALVPGAHFDLYVAGLRADGELWVFTVVDVDAQGQAHLRRNPRGPYDSRVEVWLDPQRGHWPARALFADQNGGTSLELLLKDGPSPP